MPLNPESFTTADTGILLVDKPQEWTSHDVVNCIRGRFRLKKVGHCGTLDPLATGLLVVVTGKATKLSNYLTSDSKVYQANLKLGADTDSHDSEGEVTEEFDWSHVTEEQVREIIASFLGEQDQIPPMVSAIKKVVRSSMISPVKVSKLNVNHVESISQKLLLIASTSRTSLSRLIVLKEPTFVFSVTTSLRSSELVVT